MPFRQAFICLVGVSLMLAAHAQGATNSLSEALNPHLTNTVPDNGGPVLYYNGSGPVPPFVSDDCTILIFQEC